MPLTPDDLAQMDTSYVSVLARAVADVEEETGRPFTAQPRHMSEVPPDTDVSTYLLGLSLLNPPQPPTPQGVMIAGVLEALDTSRTVRVGVERKHPPLYPEVVVQLGRRGTKTTSVEATLLGRAELRERTTIVSTAQDGTRSSAFMRPRLAAYERRRPPAARNLTEAARNAAIGLRTLYRSQGREYVEWLNDSVWSCAKPEAEALRGSAADVMWFDEAGELDDSTSENLLAGALPLLDTRPMGQAIVSGTPSEDGRSGMFWTYLEDARSRPEKIGIVDFSAEDYSDPTDEDLWHRVHPGLAAGITTVEVLRSRLERMALDKFAREYLCMWPVGATTTALDPERYAAGEVDPLGTPPPGCAWAIAFDCDLEGRSASIVASAIYPDGRVHSQVMEHRPGIAWVAGSLGAAVRAHPQLLIGYDPIGANARVAQEVQSKRSGRARQRLRPLALREVAAGASLIAERVQIGAWEHATSKSLDLGVEAAAWRTSGDSRLFKRTSASADISALIAASEAAHLAAGLEAPAEDHDDASYLAPALG
ncbi:hypothetical protein [Brachybacterium paraconglomeratum]|uniref:hypothetical protein n=1 Tax=Brachybacterium paraconglomeratum TaxID=173362 RepID=UPI0022B0500E|nr:hypothetical protein [Brachybacterium paraconglomeratum]MCZ4324764.1 hypothetical protein [Brachybacterium paraconglomeratum]